MGEFGDRMKLYEGQEAQRRFLPLLPICARLDGRAFHSFTDDLLRPFDESFNGLMCETTKFLVEETSARIGYTQSDEISLIFYSNSIESQVFFDGRIQKMTSILASLCTAKFNRELPRYLPCKEERLPQFDCRVWTVPNKQEAANVLLWRENDATKNSISAAAQSVYSHKQLHDKNSAHMQDMLMEKGINWNDYPDSFKRGTYYQRRKVLKKFTTEELSRLPEKHEARKNPDLEIERSEIRKLNMPPFGRVINKMEVIFDGEDPRCVHNLEETKNMVMPHPPENNL